MVEEKERFLAMTLRVKFLSKSDGVDTTLYWQRFLPQGSTKLGSCSFIFDRNCCHYDWLVVLDDMPPVGTERFTLWREQVPGHPENTLFVSIEPTTIKTYGAGFLGQFGHVLSSQEPFAIKHRHHIHQQCGLPWFYGKTYDQAASSFPVNKSKRISTVCSTKRQKHTLHALRYNFTEQLQQRIHDLEVFGHGHRPLSCKAEALDAYCYHLAIENHIAPHHWTEKLADSFLGACMPLYFGAPNIYEYFPEESLRIVDIRDPAKAMEQIESVMNQSLYEQALPAIREARRRVIEDFALFPMLSKLLPPLHQTAPPKQITSSEILSRHAWRRSHPLRSLTFAFEKSLNRYWGRQAASSTTLPVSASAEH